MSSHLISGIVAVIIVTNVFWWRRWRTTERSLTESRVRDERIASYDTEGNESPTYPNSLAQQTVLVKAAERANCQPEDLPERIDALRKRIGDCESDLDRIRETWSDAWWRTRTADTESFESSAVLTVLFDQGDHEDVIALATGPGADSGIVVIAVGGNDGSVAVRVGEDYRDRVRADEILAEVLEVAGGNGGGDAAFATGGGGPINELESAVAEIAERLRSKIG